MPNVTTSLNEGIELAGDIRVMLRKSLSGEFIMEVKGPPGSLVGQVRRDGTLRRIGTANRMKGEKAIATAGSVG